MYLRIIAECRRIDRCSAFRTEGLRPCGAARGGFYVGLQLARAQLEASWPREEHSAECGAGQSLTIRAMTDPGFVRIGFRFEGDKAAMASAVDFHDATHWGWNRFRFA